MKIKSFVAAMLASSLLGAGTCGAADTLLASTQLALPEGAATAELWGDSLPNGYANDLLIMLKDKDKKLLTAYAPSIKGGYNCLLAPVQLSAKPAGEQLLLSVGQGDWRTASEFRVLSFKDKKEVHEVFGAAESMGLVTQAYIKEGKVEVKLADGSKSSLVPAAGAAVSEGAASYGGLYSLVAHDVDGDGADELLGSQQLSQKKLPLADVGAVWKLDKETHKWKQSALTIMTLSPAPKGNTVNDGIDFAAGTILPRKMVVPGGEATFPVFAGKNVELQNKINTLLAKENEAYLEKFYKGEADMAFKVLRADDKVLSIQLISGKTSFVHHHININLATGEKIALAAVLNTKDKDLLPLLDLLNTNKAVSFKDKLPEEWYVEGDNLFILQNVKGQDEASGFALGNLHKFILDKKIFQKD